MRRLLSLLAVLVLAGSGCEHRAPLGEAEVLSQAESLQREGGLFWGSPVEVLPPAAPDADGHCWWQLRYTDGSLGPADDRLILVDSITGWARLPFPGYRRRVPVVSASGMPLAPVTVADGPAVLLLTTPAIIGQLAIDRLDHEAANLNALGAGSGIYPLFSVRTDEQGRSCLVYGWQGDRGIQRDTRVSAWTSLHSSYGTGTWVDLRR